MALQDVKYEDIHEFTLEILSETGIQIKHESIHDQLIERRVPCDSASGLIRFGRDHVEQALKLAPKKMVLGARDESYDIVLTSETRRHFMPSGTGVAVFDETNRRRRSSTIADVEKFVRLCQQLPHVDITRPVVTATDRPALMSDLFEFLTAFRYTTKHVHHRVLRPQNVKPIMSMAEVLANGRDELRRRPLFSVCYCPTSPLSFVPETAESMISFASYGIPVLVLSMAMGGATAPATILGEVILVNTEIIAGITLIQTLYPECPVMYGSVSSVMDMKTAVLALGAPERGLVNGILAGMANYYGIPCVIGGLSSDADEIDFQAGFEKALTAIPLLDRVNIMFGLGILNSGNTYSLEQLVLDADVAGALKTLSLDGLDGEGREVCDLIKKIGPCNHYLAEDHTLKHFREYWRPQFFNRSIDTGPSNSKAHLLERVQQYLQEIFSNSGEKVIDAQIDKELNSILNYALDEHV
jgi:trimethylamine--corrinoid protein Co-methyltransferase